MVSRTDPFRTDPFIDGQLRGANCNPAGVSINTEVQLNIYLGLAKNTITAYSVPDEMLSQVFNHIPIAPGTDGTRVILPSRPSAPMAPNDIAFNGFQVQSPWDG